LGKLPVGRPRRRWKDNIKVELKEISVCEDGRWISGQRGLGIGGVEFSGRAG
jgi:hypothetical protein